MIVESLREINLHDSTLLGVRIDGAGADDRRMELVLDYIEDYERADETHRRTLVFSDCIKVVLDINLFLATPDAIEVGYEIEPSPLLKKARDSLGKMGMSIDAGTRHFRVKTASSGSTIDILSSRAELLG